MGRVGGGYVGGEDGNGSPLARGGHGGGSCWVLILVRCAPGVENSTPPYISVNKFAPAGIV